MFCWLLEEYHSFQRFRDLAFGVRKCERDLLQVTAWTGEPETVTPPEETTASVRATAAAPRPARPATRTVVTRGRLKLASTDRTAQRWTTAVNMTTETGAVPHCASRLHRVVRVLFQSKSRPSECVPVFFHQVRVR